MGTFDHFFGNGQAASRREKGGRFNGHHQPDEKDVDDRNHHREHMTPPHIGIVSRMPDVRDRIYEAIVEYLVAKVKLRTFTRERALSEIEVIVQLIVERLDDQDAIPLSGWLQERLHEEGL